MTGSSGLRFSLSPLRPDALPCGRRPKEVPLKEGRREYQEVIMGNRAVITTSERKVGVYLHWNGGRDTIEPLLKYCELQGYRPPSSDELLALP